MRSSAPKQYLAADPRAVDASDKQDRAVLAEALAHMLAAGDESRLRRGSPWDITMPAELGSPPPSQPFQEPLRGLVMREVAEAAVFRHFFGR